MDLSNPVALFSGLFLSMIGTVLILYGKKQSSLVAIGGGLVLCVLPMIVASVIATWLLSGACICGMWWMSKH